MPVLMEHIGLGAWAKPSCRSPFRTDKSASWGIFQGDEGWHFKDHGTDESGDEISLLALHLNIDERENYSLLLNIYAAINRYCDPTQVQVKPIPKDTEERPDKAGLIRGSEEQIQRLNKLRGISVMGLNQASAASTLLFGTWHNHEVFGVSDQANRIREIRRLDGQLFPAAGVLDERKSHAIKHSDKSWPVGVIEASEKSNIILTEGLPDFLAAYDLIHQEGQTAAWAPVGMLSANPAISEEALPHFKGKTVLIFPHADESGVGTQAAIRWQAQLLSIALKVVIFDTSAVKKLTEGAVTDLNEFVVYRQSATATQIPQLNKILI